MENQVVIITGASSGIGEACAIEYAKKGANLVIAGRNQEKLEQVSDIIVSMSSRIAKLKKRII